MFRSYHISLFSSFTFCRHKLSLYAHVSKIIWDFEHCEKVAGVIDEPLKNNYLEFDLGPDASFEAVNKLWEIIDG